MSARLIDAAEIQISPSAGRLEGRAFGGPVSLFLMDSPPGTGPELHVHPYAETFVIEAGEATFTVQRWL
jgi:hypothetical protein